MLHFLMIHVLAYSHVKSIVYKSWQSVLNLLGCYFHYVTIILKELYGQNYMGGNIWEELYGRNYSGGNILEELYGKNYMGVIIWE